MRILLTAVGCPGGPTIIEMLREDKDIYIIGSDMRTDVLAKHMVDEFIKVPPGKSLDFTPYILNLVVDKKIDLILPLATFELDKLSMHKDEIQRLGCTVCVSDYESLVVANNKFLLYKLLEGSSYIPKYYHPHSLLELEEAAKKLGFPEKKFVIKPVVSHGSIGLRIVDSKLSRMEMLMERKPSTIFSDYKSIRSTLKEANVFPEILMSEYLPGKEYGIDLLIDPENHMPVAKFVRDNGDVSLSEVSGGKAIETDRFDDLIYEICNKLKLSYAINIDLKLNEEGNAKLLEINPRLPATAYLAYKCGLNLPLASIYMALGEKMQIGRVMTGYSIYSYRGFVVIED